MNERTETEIIVDCGTQKPIFYRGVFAEMMNELLFAKNSIWLKDVTLTVENKCENGKNIKYIQVKPNIDYAKIIGT